MIYRQHLIELYVNGEKLELENQKSLNLRLNNVLLDPTKVSNTQADYSFSFNIPSTPRNDRIFDYANNLAKENKFHARWNAEAYADGQLIFQGTMTINSFKDKKYNVNLVSVKSYSLDDIFGDSTLSEIPWYKPFDGSPTINELNAARDKEVCFPLVSYGVFQKTPSSSDEVANTYTSKFDLDKYNRWWVESFYPSLNMMETIRKAFEWKGYSVGGDAFEDENLSEIFMSTNLSTEQVPVYNLANPKFGTVNLSLTYTTPTYNNNPTGGYEQELEFPYFWVNNTRGHFGGAYTTATLESWNFPAIRIYDLMSSGTTSINNTYMYDPNEKCIVIPADGFYKIELDVTTVLNTTGNLTFAQDVITQNGQGNDIETKSVTMPVGLSEVTPVEIHLVRNYEDNCELIKGKNNKEYVNGNPTMTTNYNGQPNIKSWLTCFPHEDPYASNLPTKKNDLTVKSSSTRYGNFGGQRTGDTTTEGGSRSGTGTSGGGSFGGRRNVSSWSRGDRGASRGYSSTNYGYIYKNGENMAFDQAVTDNFICGFSSMFDGTPAVMKNGYSWSKSSAVENAAFYTNSGYLNRYTESGSSAVTESASTLNWNTYINSPVTTFSCSSNRMTGRICCMVYLFKDDILELLELHRAYNTTGNAQVNYSTTTTANLKIEAASPNSYALLKSQNYAYNSPSQFDYDLRLSNFLNNETQISTFIQGCVDAFNLQLRQDGNNIWIDNKKTPERYFGYAVDIDDRVNGGEAESSMISYPKSMAIKYKIDTDEWGFEKSVYPQSMLNQPDWKDYADSGFTTINLSDDTYVTSTSDKSLPFSYTWYDNFNWYNVDSADTQSGNATTLRMPVISKFTYMIDGYDYDESMKHDGYSLTQRFWYRPTATECFVWTDSKPTERINIYLPHNSNGTMNLSYKTTENSLLRYFNTQAYLASNYVTVDVYLSPEEYNDLKNGAMVWFDKDLYYVCEIEGYDASGYNKTQLKMMKKVI